MSNKVYRIVNGNPTEWKGEPIQGVYHPRNIATVWSTAELNAIGLFRPRTPPAPPAGKIIVETRPVVRRGRIVLEHVLEDEYVPSNEEKESEVQAVATSAVQGTNGREIEGAIFDVCAYIMKEVGITPTEAEAKILIRDLVVSKVRRERGL